LGARKAAPICWSVSSSWKGEAVQLLLPMPTCRFSNAFCRYSRLKGPRGPPVRFLTQQMSRLSREPLFGENYAERGWGAVRAAPQPLFWSALSRLVRSVPVLSSPVESRRVLCPAESRPVASCLVSSGSVVSGRVLCLVLSGPVPLRYVGPG
jgi:hypothetical protein